MKKEPVYFDNLMTGEYQKITTMGDLMELARRHGAASEAVLDGTLARLLAGIDIRDELDEIRAKRLSIDAD